MKCARAGRFCTAGRSPASESPPAQRSRIERSAAFGTARCVEAFQRVTASQTACLILRGNFISRFTGFTAPAGSETSGVGAGSRGGRQDA